MQKKTRKRRESVNSVRETARIMRSANRVIVPPDFIQLGDRDLPFFNSIIKEIPLADWSDHQIELAALLARAMGELQLAQEQLRREGSVVKNPKGGLVVNPRQLVVDKCIGTILSMRRSLALHARARDADTPDLGKTRKTAKDTQERVREVGADEDNNNLINMPGRPYYAAPADDFADLA